MSKEELFEIYNFLKSKNIPVEWQDYEPCLCIPIFTYLSYDGSRCRNEACLFENSNHWELDDCGWDEVKE